MPSATRQWSSGLPCSPAYTVPRTVAVTTPAPTTAAVSLIRLARPNGGARTNCSHSRPTATRPTAAVGHTKGAVAASAPARPAQAVECPPGPRTRQSAHAAPSANAMAHPSTRPPRQAWTNAGSTRSSAPPRTLAGAPKPRARSHATSIVAAATPPSTDESLGAHGWSPDNRNTAS